MTETFLPWRADDDRDRALVETGPRVLAPFADPAGDEGGARRLDAATLLRILYRWRILVLAILLGTVVAFTLYAALKTPLYRATATLQLTPSPSRIVPLSGVDRSDAYQPDEDFLSLQLGLLKSRGVAQRVARSLNLARDAAYLRAPPVPNASPDSVTGALMGDFTAKGTNSDRIVEISFVHPDPKVAARVVNGFADQAIESNIERSYSATARSTKFLQERLETTRAELERSERELIDYARKANVINLVSEKATATPDTAGGTLVADNLVALNAQLADAQNARIIAEQRFGQAGATAQAATVNDTSIKALQQQKAQLQAEYDDKRQLMKPDHPDMLALSARIAGLDRQIGGLARVTASASTGTLRADLIAARNREQSLQGQINRLQNRLLDLNDRGVQYTILKRSVDAKRSTYNALLAQLNAENTSATRTSSVSIVDEAEVPGAPFSPNVPRSIMLGLLLGTLLGGAAAIGADRWYDTLNLPDDVVNALGLPVLGVIPRIDEKEDLDDLIYDARSAVAEAYHSTRTSIQFVSAGGPPKSILVSSAGPREGKTSSSIAIAYDFVSIGKRVVLIDADLRKPSIRGSNEVGLSNVLAGAGTLDEALTETQVRGLHLIAAGHIPPNPSALLTERTMAEIVRNLEQRFDLVVIDGPPVMGFADSPLLAAICDATLFIVASGETRRSDAVNAIVRLRAAQGEVVGAILNKFDPKHYGYGQGYGGYAYSYSERGHSSSPTRLLSGPRNRQSEDA